LKNQVQSTELKSGVEANKKKNIIASPSDELENALIKLHKEIHSA
jgi:hypothetical protein